MPLDTDLNTPSFTHILDIPLADRSPGPFTEDELNSCPRLRELVAEHDRRISDESASNSLISFRGAKGDSIAETLKKVELSCDGLFPEKVKHLLGFFRLADFPDLGVVSCPRRFLSVLELQLLHLKMVIVPLSTDDTVHEYKVPRLSNIFGARVNVPLLVHLASCLKLAPSALSFAFRPASGHSFFVVRSHRGDLVDLGKKANIDIQVSVQRNKTHSSTASTPSQHPSSTSPPPPAVAVTPSAADTSSEAPAVSTTAVLPATAPSVVAAPPAAGASATSGHGGSRNHRKKGKGSSVGSPAAAPSSSPAPAVTPTSPAPSASTTRASSQEAPPALPPRPVGPSALLPSLPSPAVADTSLVVHGSPPPTVPTTTVDTPLPSAAVDSPPREESPPPPSSPAAQSAAAGEGASDPPLVSESRLISQPSSPAGQLGSLPPLPLDTPVEPVAVNAGVEGALEVALPPVCVSLSPTVPPVAPPSADALSPEMYASQFLRDEATLLPKSANYAAFLQSCVLALYDAAATELGEPSSSSSRPSSLRSKDPQQPVVSTTRPVTGERHFFVVNESLVLLCMETACAFLPTVTDMQDFKREGIAFRLLTFSLPLDKEVGRIYRF